MDGARLANAAARHGVGLAEACAGADVVFKTAPWGMIVGLLVGFAVSIWMTVRSAQRMTAEAEREWGPVRDLPDDNEDD